MKMTYKLNAEQRDQLAADYLTGLSLRALCRRYGLSCHKSAMSILQKRGVARRQCGRTRSHTLNESAFDTITEESAYWAGFLMADGCILRHAGRNPEGVAVKLAVSEANHLEALRAFLQTDSAVEVVNTDAFGESWSQARLCVYSRRLTCSLGKFGILPAKSATASVIGLEDNRHFWRGVVDGDGSLFWLKTKRWRDAPCLSLCGAKPLLEQFSSFAGHFLGRKSPAIHQAVGMHTIRFAGSTAVRLAKHLYDSSAVALHRKKLAAIDFLLWGTAA